MSGTRIAALALAMGAVVVSGCGGSAKQSSKVTSSSTSTQSAETSHTKPSGSGPLNRAQLIERGDAVCYRLNARRQSTSISHRQEYAQVIQPLAAYERQGADELAALTPPASMASSWQKIIDGSRTIAEVTGRFHAYGEAERLKLARRYDDILGKAINQVTRVAKKAGFKECSRFL
jgi:hypothetical protein